MNDLFQVAIQYGPTFGSLTYDINEKKVSIFFPIEKLREQGEAFFAHPVKVRQPIGLREYVDREVSPLNSLEEFKAALRELYNQTGLRVDWSVVDEKIPANELPK